MVRFHTVTLFSFDLFPLNFLKSLLATYYVARSFLPAWRAKESKKSPWFSQKFLGLTMVAL